MKTNSILSLICSLPLLGLSAADWPQFRGPNLSGSTVATGLPVDLEAQDVSWKVELPGRGVSSPIIIGKRILVTCATGVQQRRLHVICLDTHQGSKIWERQFWSTGRTMCHPKTSVAAASPVSDGHRVFALFSSGDLVCLDLAGNLLWLRGMTRDYPNASISVGMASSPLLVEGTLVVQLETDSESLAAGLDPANGLEHWRIKRPKAANWTSPVMVEGHQGNLAVLQSRKGLTAIDPATGREVWNYPDGASTIPSSVVKNQIIFVPSHGITALKPAKHPAAPTQLWRSSRLRPGTASPLVVGNHIYVLNSAGILNCGDIESGERIWQLRVTGPFSASPVAANSFLYLFSEKGIAQVIDMKATEDRLVGRFELGEAVLATPAIAGQALYVRTVKQMWKMAEPSRDSPGQSPTQPDPVY